MDCMVEVDSLVVGNFVDHNIGIPSNWDLKNLELHPMDLDFVAYSKWHLLGVDFVVIVMS